MENSRSFLKPRGNVASEDEVTSTRVPRGEPKSAGAGAKLHDP
jgi:hypothetical protein